MVGFDEIMIDPGYRRATEKKLVPAINIKYITYTYKNLRFYNFKLFIIYYDF